MVDEHLPASRASSGVPGIVRASLFVLLGDVAVGSLLAIWDIVGDGLDEFGSNLIQTTVIVATACIVVLASTERWERTGGRRYTAFGVAGSALGFPLLAVCLWLPPGHADFARFALGLVFLGLMGAYGAAVSRARIPGRFAWVRWPALVSMALLTVLGLVVVWLLHGRIMELARAIGVCAILAAATTICVACVQRATKWHLPPPPQVQDGRHREARRRCRCPAGHARHRVLR